MVRSPYCVALLALLAGAAPAPSQAQTIPAEANMYRQADTGWLERERYRTPADGEVAVQFVDVLVGAGRAALVRQMPGGALLDVKAGAAMVTVDNIQRRSAPGLVIPIDQGQTLSIDNRNGERAFVARLIRIAAPR